MSKRVFEVDIPFPSPRTAEIAREAIDSDPEPGRGRVHRTLAVQGSSLSARFEGEDVKFLRVSVGNFFDLLMLSCETMQALSPA
eukprot:m.153366 g.153366  ORF g.153366 m.153366 type:complete len:84 (-) comp20756_c0_seq3:124-375(-)